MQSTSLVSYVVPSVLNAIGIFVAAIILSVVAWNVWLSYIQTLFLSGLKWSLLEVRPPKEVFKSPAAMELVFNALQGGGRPGEFNKKYWGGEVSLWYSLEIASIEGKVRFFIYTPDKFKKFISSQVYAQYPQAEVIEVEDYAQNVPDYVKGGTIDVWSTRQILEKDEVIPIKTYVEYGLDRAVGSLDEEQRIDPITPMLEFMGSIGIGEQAWMQILVRPATKRFIIKNKDGVEEGGKSWTDKTKAVIKGLQDGLKEKDAEGKTVQIQRPTKGLTNLIESIERNANKYGFDTGIRMLYLAKKENFNAGAGGSFASTLRQYNATDLNNFKGEEGTSFQYSWQDVTGRKVDKLKSQALKAYKSRSFFYGRFRFDKLGSYFTHPNESGKKPFLFSTEELATLFHLPGKVVETPTFARLDSTKAEPPTNLPI